MDRDAKFKKILTKDIQKDLENLLQLVQKYNILQAFGLMHGGIVMYENYYVRYGDGGSITIELKDQIKKIHELKIAKDYFPEVLYGRKKYEIRLNDRNYRIGETILLREWDKNNYTGKKHKVDITGIAQLQIEVALKLIGDDLYRFFKEEDIDRYGLLFISIDTEQVGLRL